MIVRNGVWPRPTMTAEPGSATRRLTRWPKLVDSGSTIADIHEKDFHGHVVPHLVGVDFAEIREQTDALIEFDQCDQVARFEHGQGGVHGLDPGVHTAAARKGRRTPRKGSTVGAHGARRVAKSPAAITLLTE